MIQMNPSLDPERLKSLLALEKMRDDRRKLGVTVEHITVAIEALLREDRLEYARSQLKPVEPETPISPRADAPE